MVLAQRKEYLRQRSPPLPRSRWPRRRSHQEVRLEHVPSGFPWERSSYWIQETRLDCPVRIIFYSFFLFTQIHLKCVFIINSRYSSERDLQCFISCFWLLFPVNFDSKHQFSTDFLVIKFNVWNKYSILGSLVVLKTIFLWSSQHLIIPFIRIEVVLLKHYAQKNFRSCRLEPIHRVRIQRLQAAFLTSVTCDKIKQ